jgi:hypothetical protein
MDTRVKPAYDIDSMAGCAASLWTVNDNGLLAVAGRC